MHDSAEMGREADAHPLQHTPLQAKKYYAPAEERTM